MAPKKGPRARWLSSSAAPRAVEPPPSREQLRALFLHSLVPMVGFGIMDQTVMVTAGDLIDNTIGVRFGLATLTAAACGQVVSDVCGVCFGGTVEAIATRMGLKHSSMTMVQRGMKISKVVSLAGAVLGVITGCVLGMGTLLLIDTTSKEREKRQQEMDTIFRAIMVDGHEVIGAEAISLFFLDRDKQELWSKLATDQEGEFVQTPKLITIPVDKGIAGDCVRSKEPVNVVDCYKDPRHWDNVDKSMKTKTHNLLAVPVLDREDGSCIGVSNHSRLTNSCTLTGVCVALHLIPRH
ncbi:unnamed protein product [Chrysoparadoxa australica]